MKNVPLVIYKDGERIVVGQASVDEDTQEIDLADALDRGFTFQSNFFSKL